MSFVPRSMASTEGDGSVIKIIISSDNHLGYKERDPVRSMDSFAAFEEVLAFAKHSEADMLLLGGDIFHENKPTRKTLHQTFDLLREYVLGEAPVSFQILSDQREAFAGRRGLVNYEDPNFSISLPVFAIHGNHDDPTREGGTEVYSCRNSKIEYLERSFTGLVFCTTLGFSSPRSLIRHEFR